MKIFLSYGHDSNAPLIEKMKKNLLKDAKRKIYSMSIEPRTELPTDMNVSVKPNDQRALAHFGMARKRTMELSFWRNVIWSFHIKAAEAGAW